MKVAGLNCPHCGQPLAFERFGVVLRPLWVRIVDAILRAGRAGISRPDLTDVIYGDQRVSVNIISVHVHHINAALASTDYRVKGGRGQNYRIVRRVSAAA